MREEPMPPSDEAEAVPAFDAKDEDDDASVDGPAPGVAEPGIAVFADEEEEAEGGPEWS